MTEHIQPDPSPVEHPSAAKLQAFAVGRIRASEAASIETHVLGCETCRVVLEATPDDGLLKLVQAAGTRPRDSQLLRLAPGYEIIAQLGRGGMGVVYRARQIALDRLVALKTIASEDASADELSRFRIEAEAAARLQHANIVQVFDVGEQHGQPYLAMELVEGDSLAQRLAAGPLPPREAASLVKTLAQAVQFAHDRGILHRDLKPANVLLDAGGWMPKITDFGLAKRLDAGVGKTQTGVLVGTPSYMAPEQAAGLPSEIGPPVDIYALGAILFELLTGRAPFLGATPLETLDQVRGVDPVAPSSLQPNVPRDLETICLKCLEKEPHRRYARADELADDLQRFLEDRPIVAKPATRLQRIAMWAKRRPAAAGLIAVSTLALVALLVGGSLYSARLATALAVAEEERDRADDNFIRSFAAVDRMLERVGFSDLADVPEMEEVREELLRDAVELYQQLLSRQPTSDAVNRRRYHTALMRLGKMQHMLGRGEEAEQSLLRAIDLQEAIRREFPDRLELVQDVAVSRINLGLVRHDDRAEASEQYQEAIDLLESIGSQLPDGRRQLALAMNNLATRVIDTQRQEKLHEDVLTLRSAVAAEQPDDADRQSDLAQTRYNLAMLYFHTGRADLAETEFVAAIDIWERLVEERSRISFYQSALADCYASLGSLLAATNRTADGIEMLRKCNECREVLLARFPKVQKHQSDLAKAYCTLGGLLIASGQAAAALPELEKGLALHEAVAAESATAANRGLAAETLTNLALAFGGLGRAAEAVEAYARAIRVFDEIVGDHPDEPRYRIMLGVSCLNFSHALRASDQGRALSLNDRAVALLGAAHAASPERSDVRAHLLNAYGARAMTLDSMDQRRKAIADWDQVVALSDDAGRARYRMMRALAMASVDRTRAAAEVADLAASPDVTPADLYNLGCVLSLCAKHELEDESVAADQRESAAANFADAAVRLLADSRLEQFFQSPANVNHLLEDSDLLHLADHPGFRDLVEKLRP